MSLYTFRVLSVPSPSFDFGDINNSWEEIRAYSFNQVKFSRTGFKSRHGPWAPPTTSLLLLIAHDSNCTGRTLLPRSYLSGHPPTPPLSRSLLLSLSLSADNCSIVPINPITRLVRSVDSPPEHWHRHIQLHNWEPTIILRLHNVHVRL